MSGAEKSLTGPLARFGGGKWRMSLTLGRAPSWSGALGGEGWGREKGDTCSLWGPQAGGRSHCTSVIGLPVDCPSPLPLKYQPRPRTSRLPARPGTEGTRGKRGTRGRRPPPRLRLTGLRRLPSQGRLSSSLSRPRAWSAGLGRRDRRTQGGGPGAVVRVRRAEGSGPGRCNSPGPLQSAHTSLLRSRFDMAPASYLPGTWGPGQRRRWRRQKRFRSNGSPPRRWRRRLSPQRLKPRRSTHARGGALRRLAVI